MAENTKTPVRRKPTGGKKGLSRRWRFLLSLLALGALAATVIVLFKLTSVFLFTGNEHLKLKKVTVISSGWWNGRAAEVSKLLGLSSGVNLFDLDLKELRKRLETHPSIKKAYVARVLPDTLAFKVSERIPRAFLFDNNSKLLVDDVGMVMSQDSCVAIARDLPVIIGVPRSPDIKPGSKLPDILPAMQLIMLCRMDFTDFTPATVSVRFPGKLNAIIHYRNGSRPYKVSMPTANLREMLFTLRSCVIRARRLEDPRTSIDLNYKGQAVMR